MLRPVDQIGKCHLLRRAGWTALPTDVERATQEGLAATLDRLFPAQPILLPKPRMVSRVEESAPEYALKIRRNSFA